jgi:hypothetical protein
VSELLDTGTVVAHHKNLAIWLRRIRVHSFILEAHPQKKAIWFPAPNRPGSLDRASSRLSMSYEIESKP